MEILVEKYAQWLERKQGYGDIMPEKRRGPKDAALQSAFEAVRQNGTRFIPAARIQARIRATKLKFRDKADDVPGLQLCDLIAHPSHMFVRQQQGHVVTLGPFARRVVPILVHNKYDRGYSGNIPGYGTKYLP